MWPFYQPRYWMPLWPFLCLVLLRGIRAVPWTTYVRSLFAVWVGAFGAMGCAALVFTMWLTVAGSAFPERYAEGELRAVYRAAFDGACPDHLSELDQLTYDTLVRLDPRVVPCRR